MLNTVDTHGRDAAPGDANVPTSPDPTAAWVLSASFESPGIKVGGTHTLPVPSFVHVHMNAGLHSLKELV